MFIKLFQITSLILITAYSSYSETPEQITLWRSEIRIQDNSDVDIRETIKIHTNQEKIKRGIVRSLPLDIKASDGTKFRVQYKLIKALKDGEDFPFTTQSTSNLLDINLMLAEPTLTAGEHTYQLEYTITGYQFNTVNSDHFTWNISGHWHFPILQSEAIISFPEFLLMESIIHSCNVMNRFSEVTKTCSSKATESSLYYYSTESLQENNTVNITATWPLGFIKSYQPRTNSPDNKFTTTIDPAINTNAKLLTIHQEIRIEKTGQVIITENSTYRSNSSSKKISRTYPINLKDPQVGEKLAQPNFGLIQIDNQTVSHSTSIVNDSVSLSINDSQLVPERNYALVSQFTLDNFVLLNAEYDALLWKIGEPTSNDPMQRLSAQIILPENLLASSVTVQSYLLNSKGEKGASVIWQATAENQLTANIDNLAANSEVFIKLFWPKGFIR